MSQIYHFNKLVYIGEFTIESLNIFVEVGTSDGIRHEQDAIMGEDEEQATLTIEEAAIPEIKAEATDD